MVSKLKSSEPTAETKRARQWLGPRAKQHSSQDYSCSRGLKGHTCCSELLSPLLTLPTRGEHSTIGLGQIETQGLRGEVLSNWVWGQWWGTCSGQWAGIERQKRWRLGPRLHPCLNQCTLPATDQHQCTHPATDQRRRNKLFATRCRGIPENQDG